jgi:acetylornithine deacetylase/succinyl-diaminopimelate desuccinylase family protein
MGLTPQQSRSLVDHDRLVERLRQLVSTPSENPPGDELKAAELVAGFCTELGLDTEMHEIEPGRPSVVARWSSNGRRRDSGATLTYCSHIDVVPAGDPALWGEDPYGARVGGGHLHGRGSSDAKGPCAAALEAVAIMKKAGVTFDGAFELAFVADEESGGFKGAAPLVEQGIINPRCAVVGEPTSMRVVRAQRGIAWLRVVARGVAGHGSAPERGVNAIRHMSEIVLRLDETIPDIEHPLLGRPTLSVGTIKGGDKLNIIPASCVIELDRRMIPGETQDSVIGTIEQAIEAAKERFDDIDATVEVVSMGSPFEIPEDSMMVQVATRAIGEVAERDVEVIGFRGASDARFMAEAGAEVIVCGPGDIMLAHTAREYIELDELAVGAAAYALMFSRILSGS